MGGQMPDPSAQMPDSMQNFTRRRCFPGQEFFQAQKFPKFQAHMNLLQRRNTMHSTMNFSATFNSSETLYAKERSKNTAGIRISCVKGKRN
jgi:1,4-alpha-glucan branching enzyme